MIIFFITAIIASALQGMDASGSIEQCNSFQQVSPSSMSGVEEPVIFGNEIVWATGNTIARATIPNKTIQNISTTFWQKQDVAIFKDTIVWVEFSPAAQLYACRLSLNGEKGGCHEDDQKLQLTESVSLKAEPHIFETTVIWEEFDGNDMEIVSCDLTEECKRHTLWTNNMIDDKNPFMFGEYIVWETETAGGDWDISIAEKRENKTKVIINPRGSQRSPQIVFDGKEYSIIYASNEFGTEDILYRQISSNKSYLLAASTKIDEWNPTVSNIPSQHIVWQTSQYGTSHLAGFSQQSFFSAAMPSLLRQENPALFNKTVVFEVWNQSQSSIWMASC